MFASLIESGSINISLTLNVPFNSVPSALLLGTNSKLSIVNSNLGSSSRSLIKSVIPMYLPVAVILKSFAPVVLLELDKISNVGTTLLFSA